MNLLKVMARLPRDSEHTFEGVELHPPPLLSYRLFSLENQASVFGLIILIRSWSIFPL